MNRGVACAGLAITLMMTPAFARKADLESLARGLDAQRIQSVEFDASGRYWQFTQAPAPELPWPAFEVDNYVATLDYERRAVHAKYHRVQVQEPKRARPHAEATMDQFALNGMSWNLTPAVTAMPGNPAGFRACTRRTPRRAGAAARVRFLRRPSIRAAPRTRAGGARRRWCRTGAGLTTG